MQHEKGKGGFGPKRHRKALTHVRSGIALSNLAIPVPLASRPLKRVRSRPSLTRINSKGMEINSMTGDGKRSKADEGVVVVAQESFVTSRTARVLLAGAGFLADAYDLFVINLVLRLLKDEYPQYAETGQLHILEGSVASAALIGSILGQLIAGSLADIIGRKRIFVTTAALITIGCIGSACALDTPTLTIYGQIACWRTLLGAGVGGEYPLAATVTSESTSAGKRGSLMSAVFAMQGIGSLLSGCIVFICLALQCSTAFTWRFALAFGAVPVMIAFPYRLRMHETESFSRLQKERAQLEEVNIVAKVKRQKQQQRQRLARQRRRSSLPKRVSSNQKLHQSSHLRLSQQNLQQPAHHEIWHVEGTIPNTNTPSAVVASTAEGRPLLPGKSSLKTEAFASQQPLPPPQKSYQSLEENAPPLFTMKPPVVYIPLMGNMSGSVTPITPTPVKATPPTSVRDESAERDNLLPSGTSIPIQGDASLLSDKNRPAGASNDSASTLATAAAAAALPSSKRIELNSVFHTPVTPSSSPVQALTSQLAEQQLWDSNNLVLGTDASGAGSDGNSAPTATMMDVFRQFHRHRTNSADLTDDYGLYHIDSRHNSSNYSQTMMHMMSSSYSSMGLHSIQHPHNNNNGTNTSHQQASPVDVAAPLRSTSSRAIETTTNTVANQRHVNAATTSANIQSVTTTMPSMSSGSSGSVQDAQQQLQQQQQQQQLHHQQQLSLPTTPMFAKVKSRGLLSKSPALTTNTKTPSPTTHYPAPSSSLIPAKLAKRSAQGHRAPSPSQGLHPTKHRRNSRERLRNKKQPSYEEVGLLEDAKDHMDIEMQPQKSNKAAMGSKKKCDKTEATEAGFSEDDEEDKCAERWHDEDQQQQPQPRDCLTGRAAETFRVLAIYRWHILGTALSWFLLDVVFYANGLFNHEVTSHIFSTSVTTTTTTSTSSDGGDVLNPSTDAVSRLLGGSLESVSSSGVLSKTSAQEDAFHSILLSLIALPGYILAVLYLEKVGRKRLQMAGFFIMAMLFMICAVGYDFMLGDDSTGMTGKYAFLLIYALTFLFSNFGPNTTSFVIPGEIYPAEVRATCHGLSAASGKLGAAAGAYFFPMLLSSQYSSDSKSGMQRAMALCAFTALLGVLVTHFFIPRYDSYTLAVADARFEDKEDGEEGSDEEHEADDGDENVGSGQDKKMKLIVIALDHDCLQTVREHDPLHSDICLIRHKDDEYCEDIDANGRHHRHYGSHHYQELDASSQHPYQSGDYDEEYGRSPYQGHTNTRDGSEEGKHSSYFHHPVAKKAARPHVRGHATSKAENEEVIMHEVIDAVHDYAMWDEVEAMQSPSKSAATASAITSANSKNKARGHDVRHVGDDDDDDDDSDDISDSELYRQLETARMQYEVYERDSATSAGL